jgi:hypothetical protein
LREEIDAPGRVGRVVALVLGATFPAVTVDGVGFAPCPRLALDVDCVVFFTSALTAARGRVAAADPVLGLALIDEDKGLELAVGAVEEAVGLALVEEDKGLGAATGLVVVAGAMDALRLMAEVGAVADVVADLAVLAKVEVVFLIAGEVGGFSEDLPGAGFLTEPTPKVPEPMTCHSLLTKICTLVGGIRQPFELSSHLLSLFLSQKRYQVWSRGGRFPSCYLAAPLKVQKAARYRHYSLEHHRRQILQLHRLRKYQPRVLMPCAEGNRTCVINSDAGFGC